MKSLSSFSSKSSKSRRPSAEFDEETVPPSMKSLSMKSRPSMRSFSSKSSKSSSEELLPPAEVTVEVPYGFRAGDLLTVALPNSKKTTTLVIPEGCGPGSTLKVEPEVTVSVSIPKHVRAGDPVSRRRRRCPGRRERGGRPRAHKKGDECREERRTGLTSVRRWARQCVRRQADRIVL